MGSRAWPAWRRRAEPDREGQELWLAARLVWRELQRRAHSQARDAAGSGETGALLGPRDCARQPDVLPREQDVPAVEWERVYRRHGKQDAQPDHLRRPRRRKD